MKERVFIDTGFWIALIDKRDQNHIHAKKSLKPLLTKYNVCSSEFVVFETLTYINCSFKRHDLALKYINKMDDSGIHVFPVDETTKIKALQLFRSYSDKNLSVTDCTSFAIMQKNDIKLFAGFDDHFKQISFVPAIPAFS